MSRFVERKQRLAVVYGPRRVGKSYLLDALCQATGGYRHQAIAGVAAAQLDDFGRAIGERLGVGALQRTLATTNPIENLQGTIRRVTRNVKRWRGGSMALRWTVSAFMRAERTFRRVKGHADMPRLVAALDALIGDVSMDRKVNIA